MVPKTRCSLVAANFSKEKVKSYIRSQKDIPRLFAKGYRRKDFEMDSGSVADPDTEYRQVF